MKKEENPQTSSTKEYLEKLISVFSKEELELIQGVFEHQRDNYKKEEELDILSICIETLFIEKKLASSTKKACTKRMLKKKMISRIKEELRYDFFDAETISTLSQRESYEQKFKNDNLSSLFSEGNSGENQDLEAQLMQDHLEGMSPLELIEKYGITRKKVIEIIHRKTKNLCEMYENAVVEKMSDEICHQYETDIKHYASNDDSYEEFIRKRRIVKKYNSGKKATQRDQEIYDSILGIQKEVYQKSFPKKLG